MSTGNPAITGEIDYPDSDGEPMSDNTLQWDWMVKIVSELRVMFTGKNVFVAGDLLWYPVEGNPKTRIAPDALVAFGRPPGYRGSYKQWEEDGIAPQVVFEVLSPRNTYDEMMAKREFYTQHGVEEFYIIDPYLSQAEAYIRQGDRLEWTPTAKGFTSPRLGIRFMPTSEGLILLTPEGREFQTREEHVADLNEELARIDAEREAAESKAAAAEAERKAAEDARQELQAKLVATEARAEAERLEKERLLARLREMDVDPKSLAGITRPDLP